MAATERVSATIMGREYQLVCEPGEKESLLDAVSYVDARMSALKQAGKVSGADRIAVMAALQLASELLATKIGESELAIGDLRRRIQSMNSIIDEALAPQQELF